MIGRVLVAAAFVAGSGGAASAQSDPHLGPLADVARAQVAAPWQGGAEGGWYVLRNTGGDDAELNLTMEAGPAPQSGRRTVANVTIVDADQTASIGFVLRNSEAGAACVAEITAAAEAALFCVADGKSNQIARIAGAARLDGSDVIELVEARGGAIFAVNGNPIGEVQDARVLGGEMGLLIYDRGTFGITGFAIEAEAAQSGGGSGLPPPGGGGAPAGGNEELAGIIGPLAQVVAEKPLREGWTVGIEDGWFLMENVAAENDSFGYVAEVGMPGEGGRVTVTNAVPLAAEGMTPEQLAGSSMGLVVQNRDAGRGCMGEITGAGDAIITCFDSRESTEVARVNGVAKLDGSDVLSLVEIPGAAQFLINDQPIGDVPDPAVQGGQVGLIAFGRGRFFAAGFGISDVDQGGGTVAAGTGQTGGQTGGANAGGLQGPLPMFDGDSGRITSTYLGVLTGIFLHEFGHALIGELQVPSTGPEEDAVDIFSALRISSPAALNGGDPEADAINQGMAIYATLQWYYSGLVTQQAGGGDVPWQDEHTADLKRFRNTYCVIYGGNPGVFGGIAQQIGIDERTLARCEEEFNKQSRAWRTILAPHTRVSAFYPEGQMPADAPGARIEAVFEPSSRQVGDFVKQIIGDSGTFQAYIDGLSADYVLPRPIRVVFRDCGELNAWYSPQDGSITMCYDLIEHIVVMVSDIEMGTSGGMPAGQGTSQSAPPAGGQGGGQEARPPAGGGGATAGGQPFDELQDFGVPVTPVLFPAPFRGPTPNAHASAMTVTTEQLAAFLTDETVQWILIDTRGQGQTLPEAFVEPMAGRDGSVTDGFQQAISGWLQEITGGNPEVALIFFGEGPNDRSSYNAALRAANLGTHSAVLWYRGGEEAWVANGLPLADPPQ